MVSKGEREREEGQKTDTKTRALPPLAETSPRARSLCACVKRPQCVPKKLVIDPNGGTTVTESGNYIICTDVEMTLANRGTVDNPVVLLTVRADNVDIDLNGHVLKGNGDKTAPLSEYGINNDPNVAASLGVLVQGSSNVRLHNGSLQWFSNVGIRMEASRAVQLSDLDISDVGSVLLNALTVLDDQTGAITGYACSQSSIERVNLYRARGLGVYLAKSFDIVLDQINVLAMRGANHIFAPPDFDDPLVLEYGYILFVFFFNLLSSFGPPRGNNSNIIMRNCTVQDCSTLEWLFGVLYFDSLPIFDPSVEFPVYGASLIENCRVVNISLESKNARATLSEISAFGLLASAGATLRNCTVDGQESKIETGTTTQPQLRCPGFNYSACRNISTIDCTALNIFGKLQQPVGFGVDAPEHDRWSGFSWINCAARKIVNKQGPAYGFMAFDSSNSSSLYRNCVATEIEGLELDTIRGHQIPAAYTSWPTLTEEFLGPYPVLTDGIVYDNCLAEHNKSDGFSLLSAGNKHVVRNCIANDNLFDGYRCLNSYVSFYGNLAQRSGQNGFHLISQTPEYTARYVTVRNNQSDSNGGIGYYDQGERNVFENNRAYNNGGANYSSPNVSVALNNLVEYTLGGAVPASSSVVSNVSTVAS